jgi:hypothetical protein
MKVREKSFDKNREAKQMKHGIALHMLGLVLPTGDRPVEHRVAAFQRLSGLTPTGVIDVRTVEALARSLKQRGFETLPPVEGKVVIAGALCAPAKLSAVIVSAGLSTRDSVELGSAHVNDRGLFRLSFDARGFTHVRVNIVDTEMKTTLRRLPPTKVEPEMWVAWSATGVFDLPGSIELLQARVDEVGGAALPNITRDDLRILFDQLDTDEIDVAACIVGRRLAQQYGIDRSVAAVLARRFGPAAAALSDLLTSIHEAEDDGDARLTINLDQVIKTILAAGPEATAGIIRDSTRAGALSDAFSTEERQGELTRHLAQARRDHILRRPLGPGDGATSAADVLHAIGVGDVLQLVDTSAVQNAPPAALGKLFAERISDREKGVSDTFSGSPGGTSAPGAALSPSSRGR